MATSTEQMSAVILEIAQNAGSTARLTTDTVKIVEEADVTVGMLRESSIEISAVI